MEDEWRGEILMRVSRRGGPATLLDHSSVPSEFIFRWSAATALGELDLTPRSRFVWNLVWAGGASPYTTSPLADRLFSLFRVVPPSFLFPFPSSPGECWVYLGGANGVLYCSVNRKKKKQICVFQSGPNKMTHFEKKKNKKNPAFYFFFKTGKHWGIKSLGVRKLPFSCTEELSFLCKLNTGA